MMPLVKLLSSLRMMHPTGLSILYIASSIGESVFLYVGYMQSLPEELEAAAYIDGANIPGVHQDCCTLGKADDGHSADT